MNFRRILALTVASFWFFHYAHPGRVIHNSVSFQTQEACEAAAQDTFSKGWDVSNCRDSDNLEAGQD
jgi:hypothetical protein